MIAKFISYGPSREEAILRMRRALSEFECEGVPTTAKFHEVVLQHPAFLSGEFDTGFLVTYQKDIESKLQTSVDDPTFGPALVAFQAQVHADGRSAEETKTPSLWQQRARFEATRHN